MNMQNTPIKARFGRSDVVCEPPHLAECEAIAAVICRASGRGFLLPRSGADIADHCENFLVARIEGQIVGCVALRDFGKGLQELRSLAVDESFCGRGIGSLLVRSVLDMAKRRNAQRVFTLTLEEGLFSRVGFRHMTHSDFPQKVWSDCRLCPRRKSCNEIALAIDL